MTTHNPEIEWFIRCGPAALGERGTASAMLEKLKAGATNGNSGTKGGGRGVPNTWLYSESQLGVHGHHNRGTIDRARRCANIWHRLTKTSQEVLLGRYEARQWPPGVTGRLGDLAGIVVVLVGSRRARARIKAASDALVEEQRKGVWSPRLAELESSAQQNVISGDWDCVVHACQNPGRDNNRKLRDWLSEADKELKAAHGEWAGIKRLMTEEWASGT